MPQSKQSIQPKVKMSDKLCRKEADSIDEGHKNGNLDIQHSLFSCEETG